MKRILIQGCGGPAGINFTRSLRSSPEDFYIVGTDIDPYRIHRSEADKNYLMPFLSHKNALNLLNDIIVEEEIDLIHGQPDVCIAFLSNHRKELKCKTFLPNKKTIEICHDKFKSYEKWRKAGLKVPKTIEIHSEKDLIKALKTLRNIWFRKKSGAFGVGSIPIQISSEPEGLERGLSIAKTWMKFWGKDDFIASERLNENKMLTWSAIYKDGELIVAQTRERLYWEFANRTISGVTGLTGTARTTKNKEFDEIAQNAILSIDDNPNGIFSVDCTNDFSGIPNPTEINIGRFFTTINFFTSAGLNLPYIYIKTAFDESYKKSISSIWKNYPEKINPLPENIYWIRGIDVKPKLVTEEDIQYYIKDLETRQNV